MGLPQDEDIPAVVKAEGGEARGDPGPLCSARGVRNRLRMFGLRPSRRRGQNFLCHPGILRAILETAELSPEDTVVEIGAGLGTLTTEIAPLVRRLVAVEVDDGLFRALEQAVGGCPGVTLVHGDILELTPEDLLARATAAADGRAGGGPRFKVVANLPYYLSTPLLQRMFLTWHEMDAAVVMLQDEVARRLTAAPGEPAYGSLSVFAAYYTETGVVRPVPAAAFWPRPAVGSALVKIVRRSSPPVEADPVLLFAVVRSAFGQRRKQMRNALTGPPLGLARAQAEALLRTADVSAVRRGETLSLVEFARLARRLVEMFDAQDVGLAGASSPQDPRPATT